MAESERQRRDRLRRVRNGHAGVDLSVVAMSDQEAREAQEMIELVSGRRCQGCGRRVAIGFRFASIDPRDPERPVAELVACTRDDCGFAEQCKVGATVMEMVEFAWLDENGVDAPPAVAVVRRNAAQSSTDPH